MQSFIRYNLRTGQTIYEKEMNFNQPYSYAIHTQVILFLLVHRSDKTANAIFFLISAFGINYFSKRYMWQKFLEILTFQWRWQQVWEH